MEIYDNGGKSFDRYTIIFESGSVYGMSQNALSPQGFNQYIGEKSYCLGDLGRKISFDSLGGEVKEAILKREAVEKAYAN